ncbi:fibronectin type III domain-containing protein, partial [Bacteroidales bacterium OttesenSCG-928-E04]|nr:fibronectin type III domain-containing protein [Bacteroidales bacterium OttesenSCG-928-E04]
GSSKHLYSQTAWDGSTDTDWYTSNTSASTFDISTAEELAGLAQLVRGGNTFSGKTINLTADIYLNTDGYDVDDAENWTPIGMFSTTEGGCTHESGSSANTRFSGTFNGNYHGIHNMYLSSNYAGQGLFAAIGSGALLTKFYLKNPVISAQGMSGCIAGAAYGTTTIREVMVMNAEMTFSSCNNVGMFIGATYTSSSVTFKYCAGTGTLLSAHDYFGGFCGNGQYTNYSNCYTHWTTTSTSAFQHGGFTAYSGTTTDCYSSVNASSGATYTQKTLEEMEDPAFLTLLGDTIFKTDCGLNNGLPILSGILCGVPVLGITNICSGTATELTATSWESYVWNTGAETASITVSPTTTTSYYVTGTTGTNSMVDTVTVYVEPNIVATGTAYPENSATFSFPGGASGTYTQPCSNQSPFNVAISAATGYYLTKLVVNGTTVATFDPEDVTTTHTYNLNPAGSSSWNIEVYTDNKYFVTINTFVLDDDDNPQPVNGAANGLVTPWGTGTTSTVLTRTHNDDLTLYIRGTDRYHIESVTVDGSPWSDLDSVNFLGISGHHVVDVVYNDECDILDLSYNIGFLGTKYPDCWYRAGNDPGFSSGTTNSYQTPNSISFASSSNYTIAVAARLGQDFNISDLMVQFAFKAANTSTVFEVGVMADPEDATTFEKVADIRPLNTNWNEYTVVLSSYIGEGRHIAFRSPIGISGTHYLDDVVIDEIADCIAPNNFRVTDIEESSAIVRWDVVDEGTSFVLEYEETGTDDWTSVTPGEGFAVLTGLTVETDYTVRMTICDEEELEVTFTVPCVTSIVGTPDATTANNYLPTNTYYRYSYTQQIYLADELSNFARSITGLSIQYTSTTPYARDMIIFLAHTSKTAIASTDDYLPENILTRVYTGNIALNNQGDNYWVDITFDTPFAYNGSDNLVVVFADTTGNWNSTVAFRTHTAPENRSVYYYIDGNVGDVIDRTNPNNTVTSTFNKGVTTSRNNIKFMPCPGASPCIKPINLSASNVTIDGAEITWVDDNESASFNVEYRHTDSTNWIFEDNVSATSVQLSDLEEGSVYLVRVRSTCDSEDTTGWVTLSFTTETEPVQCDPIAVSYEENFDGYAANEYPACWKRYTSGYNNLPYVTRTAADVSTTPSALTFGNTPHTFNMAILPEIVSGVNIPLLQVSFRGKTPSLTNGVFLVGVMEDPDDIHTLEIVDTAHLNGAGAFYDVDIPLENYSGNGRHIALIWKGGSNAFVIDDLIVDYIPGCQRPDLLRTDSVLWNKAYISWNQPGTADSWKIEYGREGFAQGTGTSFNTNNTSDSITGLSGNTSYDIYVTAQCGGEASLSTKLTIKTPCGLITANGLPFTENFDTYGVYGNPSYTYYFPTCWTSHTTLYYSYLYINTTN